MTEPAFKPGQILRLVKTIKTHEGDGVIATQELYKKTHVVVMVMGMTIDAIPTEEQMLKWSGSPRVRRFEVSASDAHNVGVALGLTMNNDRLSELKLVLGRFLADRG